MDYPPTLPPGWERKVSESGRVTYKCSKIVIKSLKVLREFHQQERFLELSESMVVFGQQKRRNYTNKDIEDEQNLKRTKIDNGKDESTEIVEDEEVQDVTDCDEVASDDNPMKTSPSLILTREINLN